MSRTDDLLHEFDQNHRRYVDDYVFLRNILRSRPEGQIYIDQAKIRCHQMRKTIREYEKQIRTKCPAEYAVIDKLTESIKDEEATIRGIEVYDYAGEFGTVLQIWEVDVQAKVFSHLLDVQDIGRIGLGILWDIAHADARPTIDGDYEIPGTKFWNGVLRFVEIVRQPNSLDTFRHTVECPHCQLQMNVSIRALFRLILGLFNCQSCSKTIHVQHGTLVGV